jgi:hypothetical protein
MTDNTSNPLSDDTSDNSSQQKELSRDDIEALLKSELEKARQDYAKIASFKQYSIKNWKSRFVATPNVLKGVPVRPSRYWKYNELTGRSELTELQPEFQLKSWSPAEWAALKKDGKNG